MKSIDSIRIKFSTWWNQLITVTVVDAEEARLGRLFNTLMVISFGIVVYLTTVFWVMGQLGLTEKSISLTAAAFPFAFIPLSVFCLIYAKHGHVRASILFYVWINFAALCAAAWIFDGVKSPAWPLFIWTITIAGTLLVPHYALWMTGGAVLYYVGLFLFGQIGFYTPLLSLSIEGREFATFAFLLIMLVSTVGFLTFFNMRSLRKTMLRLRNEIIERKRTEINLIESEDRYRSVFDNARDIIYTLDKDGYVRSVNSAFEEIAGWKPEEWIGKQFPPIIEPSDLPFAMNIFQKIIAGEAIKSFELRILKKRGDYLTGEFSVKLISLRGEPFILGHIRDITERKKMEETLKWSEDKYRKIFENVQDIFYQTGINGDIIEISPSIERYSGFSREELIGSPVENVYVNPNDRTIMMRTIKEQGEIVDYEIQLKSKDDRVIFTSVNAHILFDSNGKPIGIEGSLRDITERKKMEKEREKLIATLQESLDNVKILSGLVPICSSCKKIRDDKGFWNQLEAYLAKHSEVKFTHGMCPDCMAKYYPGYVDKAKNKDDNK